MTFCAWIISCTGRQTVVKLYCTILICVDLAQYEIFILKLVNLKMVCSSIERTQLAKSVLYISAIRSNSLFQNNPENLDPSFKMDLDFLGCFGGEKFPS